MKIRLTKNNGKDVWMVDLGMRNGKRRRIVTKTKADAVALLTEARLQERKAGDFWLSLKPSERVEASDIYLKAQSVGMTLTQLWENHVRNGGDSVSIKTLKDAIKETIAAKIQQKCRPRYVDGLESYLLMFAKGREDLPVSSVKPEDIEKWFEKRSEKPAVRNANLGRLGSMFNLAMIRGWVVKNPCNKVAKAKADRTKVEILPVRSAAKALVFTARFKPKMLGYLAATLFAGIRPEECERLSWESFRESDGKRLCIIEAEASKVRQRRIITLEPAADAWLSLAKSIGASMPVNQSARKRFIKELRGWLGMETWTQDILRHTAASHLLARRKDAAAVALELGNSASILLRHYRALVSDRDTERFWNLVPNKRFLKRISKQDSDK